MRWSGCPVSYGSLPAASVRASLTKLGWRYENSLVKDARTFVRSYHFCKMLDALIGRSEIFVRSKCKDIVVGHNGLGTARYVGAKSLANITAQQVRDAMSDRTNAYMLRDQGHGIILSQQFVNADRSSTVNSLHFQRHKTYWNWRIGSYNFKSLKRPR